MLDWPGPEADKVRIAFSKVFGSRYRPFGNPATRMGGYADGREGVQWNVAYDRVDGSIRVGVNLEGMQYDDWPVARLIQAELKQPSLLALVRQHADLQAVEVVWRRDYWQATGRPDIAERVILQTPLGKLDANRWRAALEEALACLDRKRNYRGRAIQKVTLPSGEQIDGDVSPHLTFEDIALAPVEYEQFLHASKRRMQPLYEWANSRTSRPITF